jgi:CRISPR-associated protein Cas5h
MTFVAFKLTGDYAHFSHPATIYSSLTYPIPPKTAMMGFLGALIGEDAYYNLDALKYSIKVNKSIVKKSFVFNGIKNALSSSMHLKEGCQDSSEKKQFYRELICAPSYTAFLDLSALDDEYQEKIIGCLKEHKTAYTPYLGINFCIADFEWIVIDNVKKVDGERCEVSTFTLKDDFEFDVTNYDTKLTTAHMACSVEQGRIFKDFKEFIVEINGGQSICSLNRGNVYKINEDVVYFV